jgi:hypothetical protein
MSSPERIEDASLTPPAKKAKTDSSAAASDGNHKAASAVDPAQLVFFMEEIADLKQRGIKADGLTDALNQRGIKADEEVAALKHHLEQISHALEPATITALFETAIYEFMDLKILTKLKEDHESKIKHGIAALCQDVLEILLLYPKRNLCGKDFFPQKTKNVLWCWLD